MTVERPRLSVVIIARDEEPRIGAALDSVRFAGERVVLGQRRLGRTRELARFCGDHVHERLVCSGHTGRLHPPLPADTRRSIGQVLGRMCRHATLGAEGAWKCSSIGRSVTGAGRIFTRDSSPWCSVLDERQGPLHAGMVAENTLHKHAKLAERDWPNTSTPPSVRDR